MAVSVLVGFCGTAAAETITIQTEEKQRMRYGLDFERLWYWYGTQTSKNRCAQWSVVDCDVDYLRVAINCGYELEEGVYDLSAYTSKIIPMMQTMKAANPDIKFFASPRPLNEALDGAAWQPYPYWITGDDGSGNFDFNWEKCAEYLLRYLELMDSYGFKITYLDVTNEWQLYQSGRRVYPSDVLNIRNYLIANLPAHIEMPLIVAPSAWSFSQGASFVSYAKSQGLLDGFDIAASHNTGYQGTAQDFADECAGLGKEIWDTEVHGWKGAVTADEISTSYQMFDRIRAGFNGLNGWLAIGTTSQKHCYFLNKGTSSGIFRNVKYYIFKKLTNTSNYGYALDVNQPEAFASTAALIRDGLLTVWVLNNSSEDISNVEFQISDKSITGGAVTSTQWNANSAIAGVTDSFSAAGNRFYATIQANSLYCFEMNVGVVKSDFDLDGRVDYFDLEDLASEWAMTGNTLAADFDASGRVDFDDFAVLAGEWTGPDTQAPSPDPLTWAVSPAADGTQEITMTASSAADDSGVEYYFNNITDPTHDSGWQPETTYLDTGLAAGTEYAYRVMARDRSRYQNETDWSATASAATNPILEFETIFETFDSDPSARGWVNAQSGSTTFSYNAAGYLNAKIYRNSIAARYYKALNQDYDETDEFWFEYDAQLVSATYDFQSAYAGLLNDNVSTNERDMLGTRFAYWLYQGNSRGNRHDLYCYATDGTKVDSASGPVDPGIAYGQDFRVKIHYWYESGVGKASLGVYEINTDGSTGPLIMSASTKTVIAVGDAIKLNIMGLGNRTDGTSSNYLISKIDNMYFSTEAENPSPTSPSF